MTSRISIYRPALAGLLLLMSASAVAAQVNVTGALTGHAIGTVQAGNLARLRKRNRYCLAHRAIPLPHTGNRKLGWE